MIVKATIKSAKAKGVYDEAVRHAVKVTDTHIHMEEEDFLRIAGREKTAISRVIHGITGAAKAITGIDKADDETIQHRLMICETCLHSQPKDKPIEKRVCGRMVDVLKPRSKTCGCRITLKTKVKSESCPLEKW